MEAQGVVVVVTLTVTVLVFFGVLLGLLKMFVHVCAPNEALILSGRMRRTADGAAVGYRIVRGGRTLRMPILETIERMDLTSMAIEIGITGAYTKGGTRVSIEAVGNVKIAGTEPLINNAIERFLGRPRPEIENVARETLEGVLRGVVATMTPAEARSRSISFAETVAQEAEHDFSRLGLCLDTFKVQQIQEMP